MAWNFRRALRILLRKTGQAVALVVYGIVGLVVVNAVESYFVSDHFPFNILKFTVGMFLVLSALPFIYLINGREIGVDRNSGVWSMILGGVFVFSFIVGILSLTYWHQYMDYEYYNWTTVGIYAAGTLGVAYRQYRD